MKSGNMSLINVTDENGLVVPKKLALFIDRTNPDVLSDALVSMRDDGLSLTSRDIIETMTCFGRHSAEDRQLFPVKEREKKIIFFVKLSIGMAYSNPMAFAAHHEQLMNCFYGSLGPAAIFATYACILKENQLCPVQSPQRQTSLGSFSLLVEAVTQRINDCLADSTGDLDMVHLIDLRGHLQDSSKTVYVVNMGYLMVIEHVVEAYMKSYPQVMFTPEDCFPPQHVQHLACCYQDIFHLISSYYVQNKPKKGMAVIDEKAPYTPDKSEKVVAVVDTNASFYLGLGCVGAGGLVRAFFSSSGEQTSVTAVLTPALIVSGGLLIAYHFFSGKNNPKAANEPVSDVENQAVTPKTVPI